MSERKTIFRDPSSLPTIGGRTSWPWMSPKALRNVRRLADSKWPRITIVTPSFNQADFLEQTIRSVLLQGYPNLEYIVLDGGSTDGSLDVIRKYEPWIDHWSSGEDAGQADAIYRGFERATSELIAWQNSDDLYLPGALFEFARTFMRYPRTELAIGGCLWIDQAGASVRSRSGYPVYYPGRRLSFDEALLWGMGANQPATIYRREAFFAVGGFDRSLHCCFDYDSILRLTHRQRARAIHKPVACFRVHHSSKTATQQLIFEQEAQSLRDHHKRHCYPTWVRTTARAYYSRRDTWARRWFLLQQVMRPGQSPAAASAE